jgi:hypothetical protein
MEKVVMRALREKATMAIFSPMDVEVNSSRRFI